ncbi:MAG: CRISPR-associated endoribonuclease Cas6 [Firmicutes bacterium]|nr:CRISPR-associated endoribonuclease Cas6 [Bacillota bacterium]
MKTIRILFVPQEDLVLPYAHFEILQGLVYKLLSFDEEFASEIHEKKYDGKVAIKLFCFSDVMGRYKNLRDLKALCFKDECSFEIRSASDRFIEIIKERLLQNPRFSIENFPCTVTRFEEYSRYFTEGHIAFTMNTPLTVYRTEGKKTISYSYSDAEFYDLVKANLKKKYFAVFGREYVGELSFECQYADEKSKCVTRYKDTIVTGYYGEYLLCGEPDMLSVAFYCGIGAKNSMGFGTVSAD